MNVNEDEEFAEKVDAAADQPSNSSCPADLLQPEVCTLAMLAANLLTFVQARLAIQSTSNTNDVWNDTQNIIHPEVVVRFIATHYSGVMRTYPAKTLTAKFDPTSVPWYRRAIAYTYISLLLSRF
jgi:hypothetical protein